MDPIFKGATRPAMMLGIPILPCILVAGLGIILCSWSLLLFGWQVTVVEAVVVFCLLMWMRIISTSDDQKLNQQMLMFRSMVDRRNFGYWKATSPSPTLFTCRD
ncbi:MAG: VirB3 family type IV secretion system protein [Methylophilaceae bacterium]|nr:VirB3 family type IV secretion system protein [Methylophilaceae bacterium]